MKRRRFVAECRKQTADEINSDNRQTTVFPFNLPAPINRKSLGYFCGYLQVQHVITQVDFLYTWEFNSTQVVRLLILHTLKRLSKFYYSFWVEWSLSPSDNFYFTKIFFPQRSYLKSLIGFSLRVRLLFNYNRNVFVNRLFSARFTTCDWTTKKSSTSRNNLHKIDAFQLGELQVHRSSTVPSQQFESYVFHL